MASEASCTISVYEVKQFVCDASSDGCSSKWLMPSMAVDQTVDIAGLLLNVDPTHVPINMAQHTVMFD